MYCTLLAGAVLVGAGVVSAAPSFAQERSEGGLTTISLTRRDPGFFDIDSGEVRWEAMKREVDRLEGNYARNAAVLDAYKTGNVSALQKRATSVLRYDGDALWSGTIQIGTPPQPFTVYFDTTSSDLLIPAYTCNSELCNARKKYDWTQSSTAVPVQGKTNVRSYWTEGTFGVGRLIKDTVTAAGLTVTQQDILAMETYPSLPAEKATDGVFGLAFRPLSLAYSYSFPFTLYQQITAGAYPDINRNTAGWFALRLSPTKGQSTVTFGGYNRGKVGGQVRWLPVTIGNDDIFRTYWQIGASAFFLDRRQAHDRGMFIFDSGSPLILVPTDFATDFWAKVEGAREEQDGYYSYLCNSPPNVSVSFARLTLQTYTINPDDFNLGPLPPSSPPSEGEPAEGEPGEEEPRCLGALVARDLDRSIGPYTVILGEPFFKSWYMAFDAKNSRIGIAAPRSR